MGLHSSSRQHCDWVMCCSPTTTCTDNTHPCKLIAQASTRTVTQKRCTHGHAARSRQAFFRRYGGGWVPLERNNNTLKLESLRDSWRQGRVDGKHLQVCTRHTNDTGGTRWCGHVYSFDTAFVTACIVYSCDSACECYEHQNRCSMMHCSAHRRHWLGPLLSRL